MELKIHRTRFVPEDVTVTLIEDDTLTLGGHRTVTVDWLLDRLKDIGDRSPAVQVMTEQLWGVLDPQNTMQHEERALYARLRSLVVADQDLGRLLANLRLSFGHGLTLAELAQRARAHTVLVDDLVRLLDLPFDAVGRQTALDDVRARVAQLAQERSYTHRQLLQDVWLALGGHPEALVVREGVLQLAKDRHEEMREAHAALAHVAASAGRSMPPGLTTEHLPAWGAELAARVQELFALREQVWCAAGGCATPGLPANHEVVALVKQGPAKHEELRKLVFVGLNLTGQGRRLADLTDQDLTAEVLAAVTGRAAAAEHARGLERVYQELRQSVRQALGVRPSTDLNDHELVQLVRVASATNPPHHRPSHEELRRNIYIALQLGATHAPLVGCTDADLTTALVERMAKLTQRSQAYLDLRRRLWRATGGKEQGDDIVLSDAALVDELHGRSRGYSTEYHHLRRQLWLALRLDTSHSVVSDAQLVDHVRALMQVRHGPGADDGPVFSPQTYAPAADEQAQGRLHRHDAYRTGAAKVLGVPREQVTYPQRRLFKLAFIECAEALRQPGGKIYFKPAGGAPTLIGTLKSVIFAGQPLPQAFEAPVSLTADEIVLNGEVWCRKARNLWPNPASEQRPGPALIGQVHVTGVEYDGAGAQVALTIGGVTYRREAAGPTVVAVGQPRPEDTALIENLRGEVRRLKRREAKARRGDAWLRRQLAKLFTGQVEQARPWPEVWTALNELRDLWHGVKKMLWPSGAGGPGPTARDMLVTLEGHRRDGLVAQQTCKELYAELDAAKGYGQQQHTAVLVADQQRRQGFALRIALKQLRGEQVPVTDEQRGVPLREDDQQLVEWVRNLQARSADLHRDLRDLRARTADYDHLKAARDTLYRDLTAKTQEWKAALVELDGAKADVLNVTNEADRKIKQEQALATQYVRNCDEERARADSLQRQILAGDQLRAELLRRLPLQTRDYHAAASLAVADVDAHLLRCVEELKVERGQLMAQREEATHRAAELKGRLTKVVDDLRRADAFRTNLAVTLGVTLTTGSVVEAVLLHRVGELVRHPLHAVPSQEVFDQLRAELGDDLTQFKAEAKDQGSLKSIGMLLAAGENARSWEGFNSYEHMLKVARRLWDELVHARLAWQEACDLHAHEVKRTEQLHKLVLAKEDLLTKLADDGSLLEGRVKELDEMVKERAHRLKAITDVLLKHGWESTRSTSVPAWLSTRLNALTEDAQTLLRRDDAWRDKVRELEREFRPDLKRTELVQELARQTDKVQSCEKAFKELETERAQLDEFRGCVLGRLGLGGEDGDEEVSDADVLKALDERLAQQPLTYAVRPFTVGTTIDRVPVAGDLYAAEVGDHVTFEVTGWHQEDHVTLLDLRAVTFGPSVWRPGRDYELAGRVVPGATYALKCRRRLSQAEFNNIKEAWERLTSSRCVILDQDLDVAGKPSCAGTGQRIEAMTTVATAIGDVTLVWCPVCHAPVVQTGPTSGLDPVMTPAHEPKP